MEWSHRSTCCRRRAKAWRWKQNENHQQSNLYVYQVNKPSVKKHLLVVIEKKSLYNEYVDLTLRVRAVGCGGNGHAMGASKLHRVLHPSFNRVHHRIHVQGGNHCTRETKKRRRVSHARIMETLK